MGYVTLHYMGRDEELAQEKERRRRNAQRNITAYRKELERQTGQKISQQELAALAGISIDGYRGYEQGARAPEVDKAMRLAATFGCSVEDIFADEPQPLDPAKRSAARLQVMGQLDDDLRTKAQSFLADINREQLARQKALKDRQRRNRKE